MFRRLAIDSNLLVLLAVGQVERAWITRHKRLRTDYSEVDFDFLTRVITGFQSVVITPNSATEASNLIKFGVSDPLRATFLAALGLIFRSADELYRPSSDLSRQPAYQALGLADAAWLSFQDDRLVLLTADRDLYLAAVREGRNAYFFKDVKDSRRPF
jgi:hypothetical protein